ncbi:MAG: B12-binding domain-containing radical SAM protein [Chitinophagales bacterium]|nr:MAG: B12-binding domain-containing radical SAM protein [Chitinophagales bacterium]
MPINTAPFKTLRVMLINPPVLAVLEPWYDTPNFGRVGLAYLAGYLRQYPGYEIRIVDAKLERLNFKQVLQLVRQWQPHVVGLTAFTNEIKPAAYQAGLIKQEIPHVITVIGGVHLTALPQRTLEEFPSFDIGVVGEGEVTFYELCQALKENKSLDSVAGLVYRNVSGIRMTPPRPRIADQDSIPFPAWDLLPPASEYYVQSQRGCPFNCNFCMNPNGRVARIRSVDNVIEELNLIIERYHPRRISFGDELFSVDMERTHRLLDAMIAHNIGKRVAWDAQTHVRYVDEALFMKMKKAGVSRIELGIETGDEAALKSMGKGTTLDMIMKAYSAARKAKVPIGSFFLFGQPNETPRTIRKTIALAVKINPQLPMFGLMTPYPGTEVSKLAARGEAGYRLLTTDWDEYNKQIGGAMEFAHLSRWQIEWYQILAYISVFIANGRWFDFLKFLMEYRKGAFSVLRKMLSGKSLTGLLHRPPDYEEVINSSQPTTFDDLVHARMSWHETQKREMLQAKKTMEARAGALRQ